jgi:hypothetical protein
VDEPVNFFIWSRIENWESKDDVQKLISRRAMFYKLTELFWPEEVVPTLFKYYTLNTI